MIPPPPHPPYRAAHATLSISEAAAYLEVSVTTVRRLIAEGQLEGFRITVRKVRVFRASVVAYREQQRGAPPYDDGIQEELRRSRLKRGADYMR